MLNSLSVKFVSQSCGRAVDDQRLTFVKASRFSAIRRFCTFFVPSLWLKLSDYTLPNRRLIPSLKSLNSSVNLKFYPSSTALTTNTSYIN